MLKWKLLFISIPIALVVVGVKFLLVQLFHYHSILDIKEIQIVLTSGVFLIGFMLAGTMSDYKESERIPGKITTNLEVLEEIAITLALKNKLDIKPFRAEILALSKSIKDWFFKKISDKRMFEVLSEYNKDIHKLDQAGAAPPVVGRMINHIHNLRNLLIRTQVISKTGFLATGYALLETLLGSIVILLWITEFQTLISMTLITFFVVLIYTYMYLLIKDIDDPFEYEENEQKGSAEVPLFPVDEYIERLEERLDRKY